MRIKILGTTRSPLSSRNSVVAARVQRLRQFDIVYLPHQRSAPAPHEKEFERLPGED